MNEDLVVGLLVAGIPLFAVGYFMLRRQPGVFRMFIAMLLIGLGYLTATGAMNDIGRQVQGKSGMPEAVNDSIPAPSSSAPPAEAPAPASQ